MKLVVDIAQRYAKMRAHTAAHLLHTSLGTIFSETKQAGSFVDEDYVRFDFAADRALTSQELVMIQQQVNHFIYAALPVENFETSYDEAIKLGAKAFFEDKYGDLVRVVKVDQNVSTELCGGTHVSNTKDIGCFVVIAQEAVASGIKRIVALTGPKVFEYIQEKDQILDSLGQKLGVSPKQVVDKTEKLLEESQQLNDKIKYYETVYSEDQNKLEQFKDNNFKKFDLIYKIPQEDKILNELVNFKDLFANIRNKRNNENILLLKHDGTYGVSVGKKTFSAISFIKEQNIKGGGNEVFVQGNDSFMKKLYEGNLPQLTSQGYNDLFSADSDGHSSSKELDIESGGFIIS